ncbi:TetR/AcrR family transcriptional regulator [Geodermatophilus obscurus]|uniref:Transcriptional regulator, TetR family n=1 Tax=Geodermatophilus obscurus (strain ATCC 25078 / DSM 43160 / JCM 3152 / CCUG 61914 / KCC A-0152 / KCTC 9177 / NBRC 13315 / NRRL B-3577 / G-20) TaxID=526225 RepID=D2SEE0_GEOOG|nr:TetR/AcrR family transcriptional regulator [Geodermatophilus obscurus]ADB74612.1 transcriptional regulator, TetR family [Geodermatophilus obscurus DSM 43160]
MTSIENGSRVRRGRPGHSLDSLLDVAVAVFNERGYDATSMEELATRLGVTKSAIYHHVSSKVELLRLALDRALDALFAVTEEPGATSGPAIDRLEHVVRGSVRVLAAELPFVTLLLRVRGNSPVEQAALQRRRRFDRVVTDLVRAAEEEGDVRPDVDPAITSRLLFGTVNSLTEWYRPDGGLSADDLADALVATTFQGLRARPAPTPPS